MTVLSLTVTEFSRGLSDFLSQVQYQGQSLDIQRGKRVVARVLPAVSSSGFPIDKLDEFAEAGACGTAAVITPIGAIDHNGDHHVFHSETEVGPVTKKLYETMVGIQYGDIKGPAGWIVKVPLD